MQKQNQPSSNANKIQPKGDTNLASRLKQLLETEHFESTPNNPRTIGNIVQEMLNGPKDPVQKNSGTGMGR